MLVVILPVSQFQTHFLLLSPNMKLNKYAKSRLKAVAKIAKEVEKYSKSRFNIDGLNRYKSDMLRLCDHKSQKHAKCNACNNIP